MTVLVLGSTGSTGRRVTEQLRDRSVAVRAASRRGETVFDWARPETWSPALDGVTAVYVMAPDGVPVEPAFVAQAVAAGVERLVLLSTMHPEEIGDDRLVAAERVVRESGTSWTVVRAHWFNQNFDEGFFRPAILAGELVLPLADQRQAFVDATDIAAVAVEALVGDGHHAQTYEVTGPDALTFGEAVEIIADVTHRDIHYRGTPEDYLSTPEADPAMLAYFTNQLSLGDAVPTTTVTRLTGRSPVPFSTYATTAAQSGVWTP
ncbi:NmrA family protein [Kribbella flavida DSM 17836]|uniref:NmrA family protein n=1 Tax=Kribbella flavida (strain DSM 17836 / JCM 10339 / NBRC 14399) TaxID=479435 RepID=D2PZP8_KRIFD|nr:NAD(P)H-binding protein [Kribbella flavida]ADB35614.1 NmrA family protein [Kribbella flavida DSM 17836]